MRVTVIENTVVVNRIIICRIVYWNVARFPFITRFKTHCRNKRDCVQLAIFKLFQWTNSFTALFRWISTRFLTCQTFGRCFKWNKFSDVPNSYILWIKSRKWIDSPKGNIAGKHLNVNFGCSIRNRMLEITEKLFHHRKCPYWERECSWTKGVCQKATISMNAFDKQWPNAEWQFIDDIWLQSETRWSSLWDFSSGHNDDLLS